MKIVIGLFLLMGLVLFAGKRWRSNYRAEQDATQQTIDKIRNKRR